MGDLAKPLFGVGPLAPDHPLQRLRAELSGSNPYTTCVDVNRSATTESCTTCTTEWSQESILRVPRYTHTAMTDWPLRTFCAKGPTTRSTRIADDTLHGVGPHSEPSQLGGGLIVA
jgi:hypothetical protein